MTGKPKYEIEELLTFYENYDVRRRKPPKPQVHPTVEGFIKGFDDDTRDYFGMSKQTYYNNKRGLNLPWPFLPEDLDVLVFVIFAQPPYNLTWVRQSVIDTLGYSREQLIGQPALQVLRRGVHFERAQVEHLRELKLSDSRDVVTIDDNYLVQASGLYLPSRFEVRYCGKQCDRFYFRSDVLGDPYAPPHESELFNVYPDRVYQMTAQLVRARNDPEYMHRLIDRAIGTYRPPGVRE